MYSPHRIELPFKTVKKFLSSSELVVEHVRFGLEPHICIAKSDVLFTPDSDRESRHLPRGMSALPPKADVCGANGDVG
jgi:hypothetical protein